MGPVRPAATTGMDRLERTLRHDGLRVQRAEYGVAGGARGAAGAVLLPEAEAHAAAGVVARAVAAGDPRPAGEFPVSEVQATPAAALAAAGAAGGGGGGDAAFLARGHRARPASAHPGGLLGEHGGAGQAGRRLATRRGEREGARDHRRDARRPGGVHPLLRCERPSTLRLHQQQEGAARRPRRHRGRGGRQRPRRRAPHGPGTRTQRPPRTGPPLQRREFPYRRRFRAALRVVLSPAGARREQPRHHLAQRPTHTRGDVGRLRPRRGPGSRCIGIDIGRRRGELRPIRRSSGSP